MEVNLIYKTFHFSQIFVNYKVKIHIWMITSNYISSIIIDLKRRKYWIMTSTDKNFSRWSLISIEYLSSYTQIKNYESQLVFIQQRKITSYNFHIITKKILLKSRVKDLEWIVFWIWRHLANWKENFKLLRNLCGYNYIVLRRQRIVWFSHFW